MSAEHPLPAKRINSNGRRRGAPAETGGDSDCVAIICRAILTRDRAAAAASVMRMPVFFGIDVGPSFIKAAGLDLDARRLLHIHRVRMPDFSRGLASPHREVDPDAVVEAIESLLARLAPRCDGVMLCGQMQGFVLVNARRAGFQL